LNRRKSTIFYDERDSGVINSTTNNTEMTFNIDQLMEKIYWSI